MSTLKRALIVLVFAFCVPQVSFAASPSISELEKLLRDLTEQIEQLLAQRGNDPAEISMTSPEDGDSFAYGDRMKVSWRAENVPKKSEVCVSLVSNDVDGSSSPFSSGDGCKKAKNGTSSVTGKIDDDLDSGLYDVIVSLKTWGGWTITGDAVDDIRIDDEQDLDEDYEEDEDRGDDDDLEYELVSRTYDEGDALAEGADIDGMYLRVKNEGNRDVTIYPDDECQVYYEIRRQGSDSLVYSSQDEDECETYRSASDGASYTIEDGDDIELDVSHDEDDYHLSLGVYRLIGYLAGYGSDSFRFEVKDADGYGLGDLEIYVDGDREVDRDDRTRSEAENECDAVADANPTSAIRCEWDDTVIYERAEGEARGTYIAYKDNVEFVRTENVTQAEAIASCKTSITANPGKSFKCTWNGATVHTGIVYKVTVSSPNSGTYAAGSPISVSWTSPSSFPSDSILCATLVQGTNETAVGSCVTGAKASGTIAGTISSRLSGSYYVRVAVASKSATLLASDSSTNALTITKAQTSLLDRVLGRLMAGVGQVLGASTMTLTRDLTIGSSGADVTALQKWLYAEGYMTQKDTGYFDLKTQLGVMSVQLKYSIAPANGFVGVITRAKINALMAATPAPSSTSLSFAADDPWVNEGRFIQGDTSDPTVDEEIFALEATAGPGNDITVDSLPVTFSLTGVSKLADMFSSLRLLADGEEITSVTPSGTSKTVVFKDLDHTIEAGERTSFFIFADLKPLAGLFANGGTFRLNFGETQTDSASFLATNEAGTKLTDAQIMGGASAGEFAVSAAGILADFIAASETVTEGSVGDTGTFTITFEVTAIGSDVYIPRSANTTGTPGVLYRVVGSSAASAQKSAVLDSSGDSSGADYIVDEADSEEFDLTVIVTPTVTGEYSVTADKLFYRTTSGGALSSVTLADFETDDVLLTVGGGTPSCILSVSATTIEAGKNFTLTWTSENATSASLNLGVGAVAVRGSRTMSLTEEGPTQAELTVTNAGGTRATCEAWFLISKPISAGVAYEAASLNATTPTPTIKGSATYVVKNFKLTGTRADGTNAFTSKTVKPSTDGKWSVTLKALRNGTYTLGAVGTNGSKIEGRATLVVNAEVTYRAVLDGVVADEIKGLTEEEALARCKATADENRAKKIHCVWDGKKIYERGGAAAYEMYVDGVLKVSIALASKSGAEKNCKAQVTKYSTKPVKCTWNGEVFYDEPAIGSSTASTTAMYRAPSRLMSLVAGVGTVLTEIPKNLLKIFRFQ
ncbi:MAG: peptidoglycan-binding protein [Candidatus Pacebacteria bacterium]|nr:peptidoglycan-binding protein [Candidatus Paceibacterota bacterium]MBP9840203.1 peptidoglycan-binding protein [Candidatus Paceibacterota bacterium]